MQAQRLKCTQSQLELNNIRQELSNYSYEVDNNLYQDFVNIMSNNTSNTTPFMNLFWQEQKEISSRNTSGVRYHRMVIRFCLSLLAKLPSAYEETRNTNILTLPRTRTLRDYKNFIKLEVVFRKKVIDDLNTRTRDYFDIQIYI